MIDCGSEDIDRRRHIDDAVGGEDVIALRRIAAAVKTRERATAARGAAIDQALDGGCPIAQVARCAGLSRDYLHRHHNAAHHARRNADHAAQLRAKRQLAAEQQRVELEARRDGRFLRHVWLDDEPRQLSSGCQVSVSEPPSPCTDTPIHTDPRDPYRDLERNPTLGLPPGAWTRISNYASQLASAVATSLILRNDRVEEVMAACSASEHRYSSQSDFDRDILKQLESDRRDAELDRQWSLEPVSILDWSHSDWAAVQAAGRRNSEEVCRLDLEDHSNWSRMVVALERSLQQPRATPVRPESLLAHPLLDPERDPTRRLPPEPFNADHEPELSAAFAAAQEMLPERVKELVARRYPATGKPLDWQIHSLVLLDLKQDRIRVEEDLWSGLSPIPEREWTTAERAAVEAAERRHAVYVPLMPAPGYTEWRGRIAAKTRLLSSSRRRQDRSELEAFSLQERDAERPLNLSLPPKPWGVDHADQLAEAVTQARSVLPAFMQAVQQRYDKAEYGDLPEWKHHAAMLSALKRAYPD